MKACPGPRSGIDRCGSLSFAIRGIASPFATSLRHSGEGRNPEGKGGINHTQTPPTTRSHFHTFVCRRPPAWAIGTKIVIRCHRIRHSRGSGNPEGKGGTNHTQTPPTTRSHFHTLVCRHQPACAIAMKECPGPRSGIDRCGSLSFAIRGIHSSIRPPIRHSGEGRNPEGKGGINHTQTPPTTRSHFHTFVCRRPPAWAIGTKIVIRCHRIRHSRGSGNPEGKGGTNHTQTPPTTRSHFHTLVCRHQPACAIAMKECPGPRSGIDRCGSLSFAIRGIHSSIRPPIRHSGEGRNPEGKGGTNHTQTPPTTRSHFHTFVCRHQPACAIAMKECPGPRSVIDRCGSLSFAIRDIPSPFAASLRHSRTPIRDRPLRQPLIRHSRHPFASIRPPIRHSGEGRNPEGKGGINHTQTPPTTKPRFHTLVRRRQPAWTIGTKIDSRHPSRHSSESWNPEGEVWVTGMRMWTMARRRSVGTRRRVCWALGWGQAPALHFSRSIAACKFTVRGI